MNSTAVEIRRPKRSSYGTDYTFAVSLLDEYDITLPYNHPKLTADVSEPLVALPAEIISFATEPI